MHKVIAIPVRLQKSNLSKAEKRELKKYGQVAFTEEEIEQRKTEEAEVKKRRAAYVKDVSIKKMEKDLDTLDIQFARALRKGDRAEQKALKLKAEELETELNKLKGE